MKKSEEEDHQADHHRRRQVQRLPGCEVICSAFHAAPKYSSNNPARSRIRVIRDPLSDIYVPVYAGEYTAAECAGRDKYMIDGKEYEECAFCRASCPSRDSSRSRTRICR